MHRGQPRYGCCLLPARALRANIANSPESPDVETIMRSDAILVSNVSTAGQHFLRVLGCHPHLSVVPKHDDKKISGETARTGVLHSELPYGHRPRVAKADVVAKLEVDIVTRCCPGRGACPFGGRIERACYVCGLGDAGSWRAREGSLSTLSTLAVHQRRK